MADPSMQTFCCRSTSNISESADFILNFNTDSYNIICLASSSVGILGALFQIWPRRPTQTAHRWSSLTTTRGRHIIVWLAAADLLASVGVFLRSIMWLNFAKLNFSVSDTTITISCALAAAWIQYFYMVTWFWTIVYAVDLRQTLKGKRGYPKRYHAVAWGIPAVLTLVGLTALYVPDANCHNLHVQSSVLLHILPNFFANYLPITMVMIANPMLYMSLSRDMELVVSSASGQMTSKERSFVDRIKIKFSLINVVFYVCWLPNLINGILVWTLWMDLPEQVLIGLWYVMALTNPMQALFNALVYRRWSGGDVMYNPFSGRFSSSSSFSVPSKRSSSANESTPLVGSSINCSSNSEDECEQSAFKL